MVHTVVRKSFLIVLFTVTIIFPSSRREHSREIILTYFSKTLFLEHLPDKNDIFIWDRQELAEMRNLSA